MTKNSKSRIEMSETKQHSPGPWEWVGNSLESNAPGHYDAVLEATVSCGQFCYGGVAELAISDADKRLIAAAPELLAALDELTDLEGPLPGDKAWHATALAAIAKATGA
jgi:hypothetical protein